MMDTETARNMQTPISKNKFELLVHLVGFIIRIHHSINQIKPCNIKLKTKLRGLSLHANYTDRAAAAGRRS